MRGIIRRRRDTELDCDTRAVACEPLSGSEGNICHTCVTPVHAHRLHLSLSDTLPFISLPILFQLACPALNRSMNLQNRRWVTSKASLFLEDGRQTIFEHFQSANTSDGETI